MGKCKYYKEDGWDWDTKLGSVHCRFIAMTYILIDFYHFRVSCSHLDILQVIR